jgi:hypothetical protein
MTFAQIQDVVGRRILRARIVDDDALRDPRHRYSDSIVKQPGATGESRREEL